MARIRRACLGLRLAPFLILAAENLAIFRRHYFDGYGFPWDFVGTYYAAAAYWTEALARGGVPSWMPFQSMGYPFAINLQVGRWYPPMRLFPLLHIPYTLHAAVVLQCLHVLAGAIGMYALARALVRSRREALLAAFAFQLFGGFYSNAEHVDIVRAFALLPWLLWAAAPPAPWQKRLPRRMALAPLFVFLLAVGGYPGNLIAALFMLAVFAGLVLAQRRFPGTALKWAATLAGSGLLGLAMSTIQLGPAWLYRAELLRYQISGHLERAAYTAAHVPGLFVEPLRMPGDVSMNSTFVGFAVLAGVCLLARPSLVRLWPYAALALLAAAMAAGDTLPVHPLLRALAPPLGYSRFPPSDYRGLAAICLILLAAAGWRDLRRRRWSLKELLLRLLPLALLTAWGLQRAYAGEPFKRTSLALGCLAVTLAALAVCRRPWRGTALSTAALLIAIALDGRRVLPHIEGWNAADLIGICRIWSPTPARMYDAGVVVEPSLFAQAPRSRPPRTEGDGRYRASGYLTGTYALGDFGGTMLRSVGAILQDGRWLGFMKREWLPVLVQDTGPGGDDVEVPGLAARVAAAAPDSRAVQTEYGIDRVRYRISSRRPLLLVENEIYFPGWSGVVPGDPPAPAVRVNGLFRGWRLPAGDYILDTQFRVPHLRRFVAVTAAAWAVWLLALLTALRPSRFPRGD